ncbi:MAG: YqgE/AlgH family protein [Bacteroidales bacterium]|nr:YqgE/AlgH family protein [Bacteroidales bacterium]
MYLDFDFLKIEHKNLGLKQGRILISEPLLSDTYFKRSVVLLTEYSGDGAIGFVLNKPVDIALNDILDDFPKFNAKVYVGGPVAKDSIHFIHTLGDMVPNSVHVRDDIYWGGDFDSLKDLIAAGFVKNNQVRFFLGYSGWSPLQLDEEIKEKAWLVSEIKSTKIMGADKSIWKQLLISLGKKYKVWANFPENPTMN